MWTLGRRNAARDHAAGSRPLKYFAYSRSKKSIIQVVVSTFSRSNRSRASRACCAKSGSSASC
jgi:hypothetical protein